MRLEYLIYWLMCATVCWSITTEELVEILPKCKHSDAECLKKLMSELLTFHDPLHVDKLSMSQSGAIGLKFEYLNATVLGLKNSVISQANGFNKNPEGMKLDVRFNVPVLSVIGPYVAVGKVMILNIRGNGQGNITFVNQEVRLRMLTKKVEKDGKDHVQVDKVKMDFEVSRLICHFTNLFNGDKVLEDNINLFLNENWQDILQEIKPAVSKIIGSVYMNTINKIADKIPYNDIIIG